MPITKPREPAPVHDRKADHEESVRPQIGSDGKISIELGGTDDLLHVRKVGGLPAHEGEQRLAEVVTPLWKGPLVCRGSDTNRVNLSDLSFFFFFFPFAA